MPQANPRLASNRYMLPAVSIPGASQRSQVAADGEDSTTLKGFIFPTELAGRSVRFFPRRLKAVFSQLLIQMR